MRVIALIVVFTFMNLLSACYNHYPISKDSLALIQSGAERSDAAEVAGGKTEVKVSSLGGDQVSVTEDSWVFLTDRDGVRHRVPAFAYSVTESQLLAPEQNLVMGLGWIEKAELRKISAPKSMMALGGAAAVTLGFLGLIIATADEGTGYE